MQFEACRDRFRRDNVNVSCISRGQQSGVTIWDVVRYTGIDGVLLRYARPDGLLMPNVSNSYKQHTVQMQELEVG